MNMNRIDLITNKKCTKTTMNSNKVIMKMIIFMVINKDIKSSSLKNNIKILIIKIKNNHFRLDLRRTLLTKIQRTRKLVKMSTSSLREMRVIYINRRM